MNYIAKQTWDDGGIPLTMVKYRADGLTMEQLQPWIDDPVQVASHLNTKGQFEVLPDHQGHKMYHMKMQTPMILSNRQMIQTYYRHEFEDGTKAIIGSSQGNEFFEQ